MSKCHYLARCLSINRSPPSAEKSPQSDTDPVDLNLKMVLQGIRKELSSKEVSSSSRATAALSQSIDSGSSGSTRAQVMAQEAQDSKARAPFMREGAMDIDKSLQVCRASPPRALFLLVAVLTPPCCSAYTSDCKGLFGAEGGECGFVFTISATQSMHIL